MRIALLPSSGDPYILGLWLRSFERFWKNEVDKVYATIATPIETPVMRYMEAELRRVGAEPITFPGLHYFLPHGDAIAALLERCEDGYLFLVDEDAIVLRSGEVDSYFRMLEQGEYDIVGCEAANCSPNLYDRSREVFGLSIGPHFSPNFFFARKEVFEWTDKEFNPKGFEKGEYIAPLDFICEEHEHADRFVWASIQMRARQPKVLCLRQWDGPEEADSHFFQQELSWMHFGALGQGKDVLVDEKGLMLALREHGWGGNIDLVEQVSPSYWEKKLAAWTLCRSHFPITDPEAEYYNGVFDSAVSNLLAKKGSVISVDRIAALTAAYSRVLAPVLE